MQVTHNKRLVASVIAGLHLFLAIFTAIPSSAIGQTLDIDPPVIEFEPIGSGHKGDSQVFAVSVVDNDQVETVNLYFRFSEQDPYRSKKMELLGSSGIYSVKVAAKDLPIDATFIQYYLEATDTAGNRALQGFAFDPIERTLVDATQLTEATAESPAEAGGLSFGEKLLYGVAAVLVVGAIASASGGGGVSSAPGVPVTIVVDQLP